MKVDKYIISRAEYVRLKKLDESDMAKEVQRLKTLLDFQVTSSRRTQDLEDTETDFVLGLIVGGGIVTIVSALLFIGGIL